MKSEFIVIAIIATVAIVCTTIAGIMLDAAAAIGVLAAIAAIASPIIVGLLNQMASASRTQTLSRKLDAQTDSLKEEVHTAKEDVKSTIVQVGEDKK